MNREKIFLSTIDEQAQTLAQTYGLGLEIAEYCTAWNMDEHFAEIDPLVKEKINGIPNRILHGPFNELFPCAIDPLARKLAAQRFSQAISLAEAYGMKKIVLHGGYNPKLYYPIWYTEQSVTFWKAFIQSVPENMVICLENVLEEEPRMILDIIQSVDDPRLQMCLDIGHVNAYSNISVSEWVRTCQAKIAHFHIHNNDGTADTHNALMDGTMLMSDILQQISRECPDATCTLECPDAESSVKWLLGHMENMLA